MSAKLSLALFKIENFSDNSSDGTNVKPCLAASEISNPVGTKHSSFISCPLIAILTF